MSRCHFKSSQILKREITMPTKTNKAVLLFKSGNVKKAFAIFRTFWIGFTKDERRTLQIASEALNGMGKFYSDLGIDISLEVSKAKEIVINKYF